MQVSCSDELSQEIVAESGPLELQPVTRLLDQYNFGRRSALPECAQRLRKTMLAMNVFPPNHDEERLRHICNACFDARIARYFPRHKSSPAQVRQHHIDQAIVDAACVIQLHPAQAFGGASAQPTPNAKLRERSHQLGRPRRRRTDPRRVDERHVADSQWLLRCCRGGNESAERETGDRSSPEPEVIEQCADHGAVLCHGVRGGGIEGAGEPRQIRRDHAVALREWPNIGSPVVPRPVSTVNQNERIAGARCHVMNPACRTFHVAVRESFDGRIGALGLLHISATVCTSSR